MERHYQNSSADSAMTEIALALAMGFFSIMVLTMVSMGAGKVDVNTSVVSAMLQPPSEKTSLKAITQMNKQEMLIIFYDGQFYNKDLQTVTLDNLDKSGRVILALPPDLPMKEALTVRAQLNTDNLIISTLNDDWMITMQRTVK